MDWKLWIDELVYILILFTSKKIIAVSSMNLIPELFELYFNYVYYYVFCGWCVVARTWAFDNMLGARNFAHA